ncbi:MAG: type I restriction-modification system subunit M N-terminal domain-containing protein [Clostridium sp.]|nr:MAG: type I restriction-modification system subunit M N-terminal domain-containing protein [Clostridium sp.]
MITGSIKNKINAIWQDFYNENMAQTSDIVNQLTTLMFIKMLDDKQNALEAQAAIIGVEPLQKRFDI